ncbi:MAG: Stp1/IreP family PP2C-type Ser/Thr phosphatase [Deltaproteobacteria bacterium]|nr:Stp1/IreP family PP2C-type Ser/Thr phosphatase [Deltaproteobacteria bacterium]MBN2671470.1 Stp1/IreP family PP2C-type Ser/Thr phosphatase [Deltaproteobacteria bacterium]
MTADTQAKDQIHFWAATDVGKKRDHNEDNFLVDKNMNLFVVADGMGGHAAGEVASGIAVKCMRDIVSQNKDLLEAYEEGSAMATKKDVANLLEHAVHKACEEIYAIGEREPEKRGMGTTLSSLLIINKDGFLAHVGDSRIYLQRGNRVIQLSEDHSLINELIKRGKLTAATAENSPYKNAVTRAVGVYESVEVDTMDFDVLPGDQFLLASDGLTGYLKDEEIPPIMRLDENIKHIPSAFIDLANGRGGKDNITCIVVRINDHEGKAAELNLEIDRKIETIKRMPIFKYLSYNELIQVMNITQVKAVAAGEAIVKEGDEGEELYIVLEGSVRVHKGEVDIVSLPAGAHFGEMALIDKAPRSADVSAESAGKLLSIARDDFFQIIKSEPRMANKLLWSFLQELSTRLRTTNEELSEDRKDALEDLTEELFDID